MATNHSAFDKIGEARVREQLTLGHYNERNARAAQAWLTTLDRESERALTERQSDLSERATIAAEQAARSAKWSNALAGLALAISVFALIVAI